MVRTKVTSRNSHYNKRAILTAIQAPGAANRPPPILGDKNIINRRVRKRTTKIKKDFITVQKGSSNEK